MTILALLSILLPLVSCSKPKGGGAAAESVDVDLARQAPLMGQILEVFGKKHTCTVKIGPERKVVKLKIWKKPSPENSPPIDPLTIWVSDKVEIGPEDAREAVSIGELKQNTEVYCTAVSAAEMPANLVLHVGKNTEDWILRDLMQLIARGEFSEAFIALETNEKSTESSRSPMTNDQ
jgi:hypothetical protein